MTRNELITALSAIGVHGSAVAGKLDVLLNTAEEVIAAKTEIAALAAIATADAVDAATTQALTNECKAKINAIIAALKA